MLILASRCRHAGPRGPYAAGAKHNRATGRVILEEGVSMQKMSKHSWCGALVLVIALWWAAPMPVNAAPFTAAVEYATSFVTSNFGEPRT